MGNPRLWNPEYSSRNPGILLAIEIGNPSSTDKESGVQCLESRIQHWLGLPSMGRITSFIGYCKIMRGTGSKSGPQTVPWCSSTTQSTVTCSNLTMTSKQAAPVKYESWKVSFSTHGVISLLASVAGDLVQLLSTKIVHFYDKSMKLCQITTNPKTNICLLYTSPSPRD